MGFLLSFTFRKCSVDLPAPPRPSAPAPNLPAPDEDFPPEMFDFVEGGTGNTSGPSTGGGTTVCPHCTFVNLQPGGDCDVCGLPLG